MNFTIQKILVVDDDAEIRGIIKEYLEEQGYHVITAEKGQTGLQLATKEKPDLVVLDVELPDVSGHDVCKEMRKNSSLVHTPVVMLTANNLEKDEISGLKAGADDYITKPFKPVRLLARIQTAINRNQRELDANALTHLPGNKTIFSEIQSRIQGNAPYSVLYTDLNNFKAFNDRYGFLRGDHAIRLTADVLSKAFAHTRAGPGFLGHVGGDDFIGIMDTHWVQALCQEIIVAFDAAIKSLYDVEDRKRGTIISLNRKGEKVPVPIMGIAIAVVTNRSKGFKHPGEISYIAGDLKKWVKTENKSAYLIDRRS